MLFGIVVSLIVVGFFCFPSGGVFLEYKRHATGLAIGLTLIAFVGIFDDVWRLPAVLKLAVQVVSAIVVYCFGLGVHAVDLPFFPVIHLGWMGLIFTVVWIVFIVNAVNLIDGLDGLAGGVVLFAAVVNFIAALASGATAVAVLMVTVVGAVSGFLIFNWYPAKIYLGDGGAYSLGFILAMSGLLAPAQKVATGVGLLVPMLAVGLPIIDTILTVIRRLLNDRGVFSADRGHLHHVLLDAGISHKRVVLGLYLICWILCSLALIVVLTRNRKVGCILLTASIVGMVFWGVSVKGQLSVIANKILNGRFALKLLRANRRGE